jgi:antitoxin ParD1/3/4
MGTFNVVLPESVRGYVEEQVARGRYTDAGEYLCALIAADQEHEALESQILEGLHSGLPAEMTADVWASLRSEIDRRYAAESVPANAVRAK